jgi:geranylgeranyl pyrophosphate synthase
MAILAGDAMTTLAFEILAADAAPNIVAALVRELAHASGPEGMIGGQVIDMDEKVRPGNLADLQRLHRMKTGALLTASCRMGAIAAGASESTLAALDTYGRHLGLAFQIVDDILDQTATAAQLGKATGKDAAKGKITYPMLIGLDASRREAKNQMNLALEAVAPLGQPAAGLKILATFVVERDR